MKKIFCVFLIILSLLMPISAQGEFVIDNGGVFDARTEENLAIRLNGFYDTHGFPLYIATVSSSAGDITEFADTYYAARSLGTGSENSGLLFLVDVYEREYSLYAHGLGTEVFTDDGLIYVEDSLYPYLADSDYYNSALEFIASAEHIIALYEDGTPYKAPFSWLFWLAASLIIGLVVGLIAVSVMKSKMKSVRFNDSASNYTVKNSFSISNSRDIFLYKTVSRIKKPQSSSSGGGTRRSASGGSFRARGGSF